MNFRRNCMLPRSDGEGSRRAVILSLAIVLLLLNVGRQCGALDLPNAHYSLIQTACKDKLSEWSGPLKNPETSSNENNSLRPASQSNGVFMRGTWRQVATSSARSGHVVRAPFLSSGEGMFDFFSAQWTAVVNEASQTTIQNISGQLFFRDTRDHGARPGSILQASGLHNKKAGEICLLGCVQTPLISVAELVNDDGPEAANTNTTGDFAQYGPFFREDTQGCIVRGFLTISTSSKAGRKRSHGILESLKTQNEDGYFTEVNLLGSMVDNKDQKALYHFDVLVRALIYAVEAIIVGWQIAHSIRSPCGYFVSVLMILIQIVVMVFLAVHLIYIPIHLLTYQRFKYLISTVALVPWFVFVVVIILNMVFFWVVLRKRRITHRLRGVEEKHRGFIMAAVCTAIYTITGVLLWSLQNFDTYLQVVWCWFLLPQVVANAFWDVRGVEPLHWTYVVGLSLCRIGYIGFNAVRPTIYGYDDLNLFPNGWFWGITGTVILFASYALLQQRYGGRSFLPQSWFGYQQLAGSTVQSEKEPSKTEDAFAL